MVLRECAASPPMVLRYNTLPNLVFAIPSHFRPFPNFSKILICFHLRRPSPPAARPRPARRPSGGPKSPSKTPARINFRAQTPFPPQFDPPPAILKHFATIRNCRKKSLWRGLNHRPPGPHSPALTTRPADTEISSADFRAP